MSEADIEEDIKIIKRVITTKFSNDYSIDSTDKQAIENILADRAKLEKENKKLKNQEEKDFTLVYMQGYEACKTNLQVKANKYNSLVEKIKDKINKLDEIINECRRYHKHTVIEATIVKNELQELLEEDK